MKLLFLFILSFVLYFEVANAQVFYSAPVTGTAGASALVLTQNNSRGYLLIENIGATTIIAKLGSTITSSNEGVQIPAGGSWEPINAPANSLYLKALSGSPAYVVIWGNN